MKRNVRRFAALLLSLALIVGLGLPGSQRTTSLVVPASAASTEDLKQKIADLDEAIEASEEKIAENEKNKAAAESSASSLQTEVDALQTQISAYNEKIDALNEQIAALNDNIAATQESISETSALLSEQQEKVSETQALLGERLSAMYEAGNVSKLEILLEADSFSSFLNRLELITRISKHDSEIIEQLENQTEELSAIKQKLETSETQMQADKQEIQSAKTEQQEAKSQIVSKKSTLDTKVNTLNTYIDGLDQSSEELESYVAAARAQQQAYMNAINASLAVTASTGSGQVASGTGQFVWPVPSSHNVSSGYGPRGSSYHYGIDITGSHGCAVVAADNGTVVISSNACSHDYGKSYNCGCNGGYGNYVVIDNGDGLLTYYAHLAHASAYVGQRVSQGQQIGTLGSSGYSTGNHCHFEVRVNDGTSRSVAARNPYNYF